MKKVITAILLLTLITNSTYSVTMEDSYNSVKQYDNSIKLGNPDQMGNKIIFDKDTNISNFSNMEDKELTDKGSQALNSSQGQFLQQSEFKKIDALNEYDLNPKNPLITNSIKIELDPLKHTEGNSFSSNEKITKIKINKTCTEGVEFNVDIIKQLHAKTELVEKWDKWQDRSINYWDVPYRWLYPVFWKKKRYGMHMRSDPGTMHEIRVGIAVK